MNIYTRDIILFLIGYPFLIFIGCKEIPPKIDFSTPCENMKDTTYVSLVVDTPQQKVVLLEEFTGVRCVPCVKGHLKAAELLTKHPGRLIVVEIHSYSVFSKPYSYSNHDFRTSEADGIYDLVGPVGSWPTGLVDRKSFSGAGSLLISNVQNWEAPIDIQLLETPLVNIDITNNYSSDLNEVVTSVNLHYLQQVQKANRLSVMLIENNIIDPQATDSGVVDDYVHNHVLRTMLTPYNGVVISEKKEPGRVIIKEFCKTIHGDWDPDQIEIVAFVHYESPDRDSISVLQSAIAHLK